MGIYLVNGIILAIILLSALLFDMNLQLGKFHGLVFGLYSLYGSILQVLVNAILGLWRKKNEHYIVAGVLAGTIILVVIGVELFSS